MDEPGPAPYRLHIVHAGDHGDYAEAVAVIARQERKERESPQVCFCVKHAKSPEELAWELTKPVEVMVFTGHGSPDGTWFGAADGRVGLDPGKIAEKAGRPISANGLIIDACYGWSYRTEIQSQSRRQVAYLAPEGLAPYSHTWLVTAVLLALVAPGNTLLGTVNEVQRGMKRGIEAANAGWPQARHDRWHSCILPGTPAPPDS